MFVQTMGLITALAVIVEALMENFFQSLSSSYKTWAAAVIGVVLCVAYGADVLSLLGYTSLFSAYVGQVLTGLLIGRGSNYINDLISRVRMPKMTELRAESLEIHTSQGSVDNNKDS